MAGSDDERYNFNAGVDIVHHTVTNGCFCRRCQKGKLYTRRLIENIPDVLKFLALFKYGNII